MSELILIDIELPYPNSELSTNTLERKHFRVLNRHKIAAKKFGYYAALSFLQQKRASLHEYILMHASKKVDLNLDLVVYHKHTRRLDNDNLHGALKYYQDAIFLALTNVTTLKSDDKQIVSHQLKFVNCKDAKTVLPHVKYTLSMMSKD